MKRTILVFVLVALTALAAACQQQTPTPTPSTGASKPNVIIVSPPSNASVPTGQTVEIQSTSADPEGIVLVELIIDGQTIQNSPTPNGQPQQQFSVIQTWTATTPGTHNITVKSTNARLGTGEANITLNVTTRVAQATATLVINNTPIPEVTDVPVVVPTATPLTAVPPATNPPTTCTLASTFVSDVTIPDGTVIAPGGSFVKTWAIQNSGTCAWGGGYNAILVGGQGFGAVSPQPVSSAGPGDVINVSINMIAPTSPGAHSSVWQLQASNGVAFGTKFDAVISIPGAQPTARPPTAVPPTNVPPSGCSGVPRFNGFVATPQTINPGQVVTLTWGQVQNASAAYLTSPSGTQGVGTPGSLQVQPSGTTTYTLTAYCNNNPAQIQVTVNVNGGGGGCNGTPNFNGFFVNPQTISSGGTTTLNWGLVTNASAVYLQLPDKSEGVASPGSRNVKPGATTTYKLIAYCGNNQASISTTVNVNGGCSGTPNFNGFNANPGTINKGQSSTLSWGIVTNATSVVLQTPNGNSGVGTPGQIKVSPGSTTTYTLIAYCNNNSAQQQVTVKVNNPQPTPTPTPLPGNNEVIGINVFELSPTSWQLKIRYYYNGLEAPGRLNAAGSNNNAKQPTNTGAADIVAGETKTASIIVKSNGRGKPTQFWACIVSRSHVELACKTVNYP